MNDELYLKAMEFGKNFQKRYGMKHGLSNIYVAQLMDRDGNVIEENYGMNVMTDYGMTQMFTNHASFPTNLYIGSGDGLFDPATNTMYQQQYAGAANTSSGGGTLTKINYPMYFNSSPVDPEDRTITCVCRYMVGVFTYNIGGGALSISEYGIGSSTTNLWTHSHVYNTAGQQITVVKPSETALVVTVFLCMSYSEKLITDAWSSGKSIVITTMNRFFNEMGYSSSGVNSANTPYTFKADSVYQRTGGTGFGYTSTGFTKESVGDNLYVRSVQMYTNMGEYTLSTVNTDTSGGYIDGTVMWDTGNGFSMIERETMSSPISFDVILSPLSSNMLKKDGLSYSIGDPNGVPFTQMSVSKVYCFNYQTGQYDIEESFVNDPDKWYNEIPMSTTFANDIYYTTTSGGTTSIQSMKVMVNLQTNDPIVSVTSAPTLYATDKYWDINSWTFIDDPVNIPVSVQSKKYWISPSNFTFERGLPRFKLTQPSGYEKSFGFTGSFPTDYSIEALASTDGKFFVMQNKLFRVSDKYIHNLGNYGYIVINGTSVVIFNGDTLYKTNFVEIGSMTNTSSVNDANMPDLNSRYITEGNDGWCMFYNSATTGTAPNTALLVHVSTNLNITQSVISNVQIACMINLTTNYAYIETSDTHTINIVNAATGASVRTVSLDTSTYANNPVTMFGYRNLLYVSDCSTYTCVIDTSTGTVTSCSVVLGSSLQSITAIDECMISYGGSNSSRSTTYYFRYDNPTFIGTLGSLTTSRWSWANKYELYKQNGAIYCLWYCGASQYSFTPTIEVYDFGHYMYDGTTVAISATGASRFFRMNNLIVQQNNSYCITNWIPHRIVGTTTTISTVNNPVHISGKQWGLKFTNVSTNSWSGKPPGTSM